jgi:hypothetical protein
MRKAQAALEFLTTYGWAFIVILVMIGALAYFGVLNPSKVTPNRCLAEAGLECKEYRMTEDTVSIILNNRKGTGMIISAVTARSDVGTPGPCLVNGAAFPATILSEGSIDIECVTAAAPFPFTSSVGNKVKVDFTIIYTIPGGTLDQTAEGSVYTQVQ